MAPQMISGIAKAAARVNSGPEAPRMNRSATASRTAPTNALMSPPQRYASTVYYWLRQRRPCEMASEIEGIVLL